MWTCLIVRSRRAPTRCSAFDDDATTTANSAARTGRGCGETHPDTGGDVRRSSIAVQRAWEQIGTPEARAAYDGGSRRRSGTWTTRHRAPGLRRRRAPARAPRGRRRAPTGIRAAGTASSTSQLLHEWVGRGVDVPDPYDITLVRSAPREIQHLLASAVAEEDTAVVLASLGIGFTVWNDVRTDPVRRTARPENGLTAGPAGRSGQDRPHRARPERAVGDAQRRLGRNGRRRGVANWSGRASTPMSARCTNSRSGRATSRGRRR